MQYLSTSNWLHLFRYCQEMSKIAVTDFSCACGLGFVDWDLWTGICGLGMSTQILYTANINCMAGFHTVRLYKITYLPYLEANRVDYSRLDDLLSREHSPRDSNGLRGVTVGDVIGTLSGEGREETRRGE